MYRELLSEAHGPWRDIVARLRVMSIISNSTLVNFAPICVISSARESGSQEVILTFFIHAIGFIFWRVVVLPCIPIRALVDSPWTQPREWDIGALLIPTLVLPRERR